MEHSALEHLRQFIESEIKTRIPTGGIDRVAVLEGRDDPLADRRELAIEVFLAAEGEREDRERMANYFGGTYRQELERLREDLAAKLPEVTSLAILFDDDGPPGLKIKWGGRSFEAGSRSGGDLTPVMARLGPTDLQTLDTLISAGIASNRADAVRWALARIRERPAYEQLRAKAREIEELKSQF